MPLLTAASMPYVSWFVVLLIVCAILLIRASSTDKLVVTGKERRASAEHNCLHDSATASDDTVSLRTLRAPLRSAEEVQ